MGVHAECGRGWASRCASSKGKKCRCRCGGTNHGRLVGSPQPELAVSDRAARWSIVRSDGDSVTIRDEGPWDKHRTVTNDAEHVVAQMVGEYGLGTRRLFYYDSDNQLDEILVSNGVFAGFAPGAR